MKVDWFFMDVMMVSWIYIIVKTYQSVYFYVIKTEKNIQNTNLDFLLFKKNPRY